MALTIIEAAKYREGVTLYERGVIETFAESSGVLRVLPFQDIPGNALRYNREEKLPGIGFRGVNEAFPESTGILNPVTEPLVIAGGDLDVDRFILKTMGEDQRTVQENMKVKALALAWERTFFKGSEELDPRQFDGLQSRVTGNQLVPVSGDAAPTANGDPLSLFMLDTAIDKVAGATHIFLSKTMRNRLTQAARDHEVGGIITWEKDEFGRRITMYDDLPLVTIENDNEDRPILGFNEVGPGGGTATTTSIYIVALGDGKFTGIQNENISVRDLNELESKPAERTRVEWYSGIAIFHGKSVARLYGISNAAVVK